MRKKILIRQRDATDCASACLASVAAYYRLRIPVAVIRRHAGTDQQGTNIAGMLEAAGKLHFQAKAGRGNIASLSRIPLPAIAHLVMENGMNHFVVIYKIRKASITYMDPAGAAMMREDLSRFAKTWSGIMVLLIPGGGFIKGDPGISPYSRFWLLVRPHRRMMTQAFAGAVVYTILGLSASFYVQKIVDFVLPDGNIRLMNLMGMVMMAILFFQTGIGYVKTLLSVQTGQRIDATLIVGYYQHLMRLPQRFFDTMRIGEIMSRVNDAVKIRLFINEVALGMVVNFLITVFSIGLMFLYYWKLALLMVMIMPCYGLLYMISNACNKKWQRKSMEAGAALETQLVESISSVATIRKFAAENFFGHLMEAKFVPLMQCVYRSNLMGIRLSAATEWITHLFTIMVLWAGSIFVVRRELSAGELLSFYTLTGYFTGPALSLVGSNKYLQDALIAADRLFEIVDLETVSSPAVPIELTEAHTGNIILRHIQFRYGNRLPVFTDLSLEIGRGTMTAIAGESGSGKSTLMHLLQNIHPPESGQVMIGNIDIRHVHPKNLLSYIGIVPQQVDLFSGSIRSNIALGEYEPDMEKILELSRLLGLDDFIGELPGGYDAVLGERGVNLSGGQKQRIAIVRALYRNPEILLLDEATASLDPFSEEKVQEALKWFVGKGKTIIVIAHRLSVIKNCDRLIVLKAGRVDADILREDFTRSGNTFVNHLFNQGSPGGS
jgi:ATP-binding cassette, subfamily C, bacteriocin exporter